MKTRYAVAALSVVLSACVSLPPPDESPLSEAGERMQAAMKECVKEDLARENAVEQIDCIGKAKIQAGYESNNPFMWNIEADIKADRLSAIQYAEGKIDRETYMEELDAHWATALQIDIEERNKNTKKIIKQSEAHTQNTGCAS